MILGFFSKDHVDWSSEICLILAGCNKQIEGFFVHNPGFPSRFPHSFQFQCPLFVPMGD
jgi:hypothetical protein